jgi:4-hydroxy-3-polyprenylbenzoate decarboxylase
VGIGGASGAPYAARLLDHLRGDEDLRARVAPTLVFSKVGRSCWAGEVGERPADRYPDLPIYDAKALTAPMASGSGRFDAMIIVPCSASGLGRIATGSSADLLGRAAEVMLKERRRLVLCLREAPYHLMVLRNMASVTEAGAVVLPLSPPFYQRPQTIDDLLDSMVGRMLDLVGVEHGIGSRWEGSYPTPPSDP